MERYWVTRVNHERTATDFTRKDCELKDPVLCGYRHFQENTVTIIISFIAFKSRRRHRSVWAKTKTGRSGEDVTRKLNISVNLRLYLQAGLEALVRCSWMKLNPIHW